MLINFLISNNHKNLINQINTSAAALAESPTAHTLKLTGESTSTNHGAGGESYEGPCSAHDKTEELTVHPLCFSDRDYF